MAVGYANQTYKTSTDVKDLGVISLPYAGSLPSSGKGKLVGKEPAYQNHIIGNSYSPMSIPISVVRYGVINDDTNLTSLRSGQSSSDNSDYELIGISKINSII